MFDGAGTFEGVALFGCWTGSAGRGTGITGAGNAVLLGRAASGEAAGAGSGFATGAGVGSTEGAIVVCSSRNTALLVPGTIWSSASGSGTGTGTAGAGAGATDVRAGTVCSADGGSIIPWSKLYILQPLHHGIAKSLTLDGIANRG